MIILPLSSVSFKACKALEVAKMQMQASDFVLGFFCLFFSFFAMQRYEKDEDHFLPLIISVH